MQINQRINDWQWTAIALLLAALSPSVGSGETTKAAERLPLDLSVPAAPLIQIDAGTAITTPRDGLWTIGSGWDNDAPSEYVHGSPDETLTLGDWTVHSGTIETADGTWRLTDEYRKTSVGQIQAKRRWHYQGEKPTGPVVLSIRFQVDRGENGIPLRPFLPGILYFGNPSGTRIDRERVPTWSGKPGAESWYEEHRYPLPFASVESNVPGGGEGFVAALHSRPSILPHGARDDLWWSLGLTENQFGTELCLFSGPVASNGKRGIVKARQRTFLPYENAYLTAIEPDTVIEKEFWLQLEPNDSAGHGFRKPLWRSIDLFDPRADRSMPSPVDVVAAKLRDTFARWHEDDRCQGFRTRPPQAQTWFMMGWADRAEVPGYALMALDLQPFTEQAGLWQQRGIDSLDFLVSSPPLGGNSDGDFSIVYDYERHEWLPRQNLLSQAQALNAIADAVRVASTGNPRRQQAASRWRDFLRGRLSRIADQVLADDWYPVSTNQAFAIAPLVKASELLQDERLMNAARKLADQTIVRHMEMTEPYWGGTLDAKCEDKEGAWAALQGFAELYRATKDKKYLEAAIHAGDVCLSYLYVWDVCLPPGPLADHALKTRGWTSVSVQNQHLDVFGVLFTPQLWQLGTWTGDDRYHQLARLMFVSCGQMTDLATGVQGEQLFQTNYQQHDAGDTVEGMRGGYSERWNIYWISAHFLAAAAGLEHLGVEWREF